MPWRLSVCSAFDSVVSALPNYSPFMATPTIYYSLDLQATVNPVLDRLTDFNCRKKLLLSSVKSIQLGPLVRGVRALLSSCCYCGLVVVFTMAVVKRGL